MAYGKNVFVVRTKLSNYVSIWFLKTHTRKGRKGKAAEQGLWVWYLTVTVVSVPLKRYSTMPVLNVEQKLRVCVGREKKKQTGLTWRAEKQFLTAHAGISQRRGSAPPGQ